MNSKKELERQERGENPLVWASIVMAKDILQGRGVSQTKLEKLLPPSGMTMIRLYCAAYRSMEVRRIQMV